MSDPLKAWLECPNHPGEGPPHVANGWDSRTNSPEPPAGGVVNHACDGGREVLLTPTDDIDTERIIAESVARHVETVGDAVDAAVQARKRLQAAVGTTWTIKETDQ